MRSVILAVLLVLSSSSAWSAVFSIGNGNVNRLVNVINQANRTPEPDTIRLAPGDYDLKNRSLPSITSPVAIHGYGARISLSVDGTVFKVDASGHLMLDDIVIVSDTSIVQDDSSALIDNNGTLTLNRVVIRGGGRKSTHGRAISNGGSLVMTQSTIEDIIVTYLSSGLDNRGTAIVTRSVFRENFSEVDGGIINNSGSLWLMDSVVRGNHTSDGDSGILNEGFVHIENTTISGNTGCSSIRNSGDMTISNSTVSGNDGIADVSACTVVANNGQLRLRNATIADNRTQEIDDIVLPAGLSNNGDGVVTVEQSIIARNVMRYYGNSTTDVAFDCEGGITSLGFNLMGEGCPTNGPRDRQVELGDVFATLLGPLQDNGGPKVGAAFEPMLTHAPLPGSLAINAIPEEQCLLPRDQRGESRPDHFSDQCDIGAVEIANPEPPSCVLRFGDAPGFFLCEETPTTCAFNAFLDRGTCEQMCASLGSTCLGALDNDGDRCDLIPGSNDTCQTVRQTEICICSR